MTKNAWTVCVTAAIAVLLSAACGPEKRSDGEGQGSAGSGTGGSGEIGGSGGGGTSGSAATAGSSGGAPSCSTSCQGCCDYTTCVALSMQSATACGKNGANCAPCGQGYKCADGQCVVDMAVCSPASCADGCCSNNKCARDVEQDWLACGKGGGACAKCGTGALCTSNGTCDEAHWSPSAKIRLRMGVVQAACSACESSVDWNIDPYVRFFVRGQKYYSATCTDYGTSACDLSKTTPPFVIQDLIPTDFTDGKMEICLYDDDGGYTDSDLICCMKPALNPFTRKTGEYAVDPKSCNGPGTLMDFRFRLEGMP